MRYDSGHMRFNSGQVGFDSVRPRFDSGHKRLNSGHTGFKLGHMRFDSGVSRFESGPTWFSSGHTGFESGQYWMVGELPGLPALFREFACQKGLSQDNIGRSASCRGFLSCSGRLNDVVQEVSDAHIHAIIQGRLSSHGGSTATSVADPQGHVAAAPEARQSGR